MRFYKDPLFWMLLTCSLLWVACILLFAALIAHTFLT